MEKTGDSFKSLGKNLDGVSSKMKNASSALQPLTVVLPAFGTAGIVASEKIDNTVFQFQSKMGATGKDLKGYETNLENVAKTGVGSFDEVATGIVDVNKNMKGLSGKEIENVTETFAGLDPETQKLIVGIGMFLAVLAPLLAVGGSLISVVAKMATNCGLLFSSLGKVKGVGSRVSKIFMSLKSVFVSVIVMFSKLGGLLLKTITGIGGGIRALFMLIMANSFITIDVAIAA